MAVRMRLRRTGKKKQAYYRVVVTDSRSPRDGRFIESVGHYDPHADPAVVNIDGERALHWLKNGALPSDTVRSLLSKQGLLSKLAAEVPGHAVLKKPVVRRSKKARAADAKAAEDKKAAAEAEAKAAAEAEKKAAEEAAAKAKAEAEAAEVAEEPVAEEEAAPQKEAEEEADA